MTVDEYRRKYPRCSYCVHGDSRGYGKSSDYIDCNATGKTWLLKHRIRWFCRLFKAKCYMDGDT